jgi:hypothetical protein
MEDGRTGVVMAVLLCIGEHLAARLVHTFLRHGFQLNDSCSEDCKIEERMSVFNGRIVEMGFLMFWNLLEYWPC